MAKFLIKYLITQYKKEIYEKCMRCDKKESQNNNSFEFVDKNVWKQTEKWSSDAMIWEWFIINKMIKQSFVYIMFKNTFKKH